LLPLVHLKHEKDFVWVVALRVYIVAQRRVIGVVLMQEDVGKLFVVAYASRRLLDAETRYTHVE
jgi:hypothetical protein